MSNYIVKTHSTTQPSQLHLENGKYVVTSVPVKSDVACNLYVGRTDSTPASDNTWLLFGQDFQSLIYAHRSTNLPKIVFTTDALCIDNRTINSVNYPQLKAIAELLNVSVYTDEHIKSIIPIKQ